MLTSARLPRVCVCDPGDGPGSMAAAHLTRRDGTVQAPKLFFWDLMRLEVAFPAIVVAVKAAI